MIDEVYLYPVSSLTYCTRIQSISQARTASQLNLVQSGLFISGLGQKLWGYKVLVAGDALAAFVKLVPRLKLYKSINPRLETQQRQQRGSVIRWVLCVLGIIVFVPDNWQLCDTLARFNALLLNGNGQICWAILSSCWTGIRRLTNIGAGHHLTG